MWKGKERKKKEGNMKRKKNKKTPNKNLKTKRKKKKGRKHEKKVKRKTNGMENICTQNLFTSAFPKSSQSRRIVAGEEMMSGFLSMILIFSSVNPCPKRKKAWTITICTPELTIPFFKYSSALGKLLSQRQTILLQLGRLCTNSSTAEKWTIYFSSSSGSAKG